MSSKLIGKSRVAQGGAVAIALEHVKKIYNRNGSRMFGDTLAVAGAAKAISMESLNDNELQAVSSELDTLRTSLESLGMPFQPHQIDAAQASAVLVSDPFKAVSAPVGRQMPAMEGMWYPAVGEGAMEKRIGLESFDNRENAITVPYSVVYNLYGARQNEFGETLYPTVVVAPDQYGYDITVRLVQVMEEFQRKTSGEASDDYFGKRNILNALLDHTILRNDQLRCIPVYRDEAKDKFVDPALVAPVSMMFEGVSIDTAPLAVGKKVDLIAISQTDKLLESGVMTVVDALDSFIQLDALYLKVGPAGGAEAIKLGNLSQIQASMFTDARQGNQRRMTLAFETKELMINKSTKRADGSDSVVLKPIIDGKYTVRLGATVFGDANLEIANLTITPTDLRVYSVENEDGQFLDLSKGAGKTIADLFVDAEIVGYDQISRRTNSDLRERGQLIDQTSVKMVYGVPLLAPIHTLRPVATGDANDASDLAALVTATHVRTSNEAVTALLLADQTLAGFVSHNGGVRKGDPEILGPARYLVTPFYETDTLDMLKLVNSVTSHERAADVQSVLVNKIRDVVFRMYRDSAYGIAADAMAGGMGPKPTIIIATDPVLARYMQVTGDFRLIHEEFDVKIVDTMDLRMKGQIFITFGQFGGESVGVPNPLHFGNMAWKPELTMVLPIQRGGATVKELSVQPSFKHFTNLPILAKLVVTGIHDVMTTKVAIDFFQTNK